MYGLKHEPFLPRDVDLEFTRNIVNALTVGGQWGIPRCSLVYKKTGDNAMKLENYLIPDLATHMIKEGMVYQGMDAYQTVEKLKQQQSLDHNAFVVCCKELGIEVDDSVLDEQGHR